MVRYLVSLNWDGFIRSTILAAFEAYGTALVGITPVNSPAVRSQEPSGGNLPFAQRG
jgi:hypothetical protein